MTLDEVKQQISMLSKQSNDCFMPSDLILLASDKKLGDSLIDDNCAFYAKEVYKKAREYFRCNSGLFTKI
ncbi:MAG: hypothetical protein P1U74_11360 [Legionellaceae bacterium]|nr:hypothetical protein [Legionellaceae bacterium]